MALNIKKLLVSQPKPASEKSPYFDIAEKYGVEIDFRPFIKVEPLSSKEFRQQKNYNFRAWIRAHRKRLRKHTARCAPT